MDIARLGLAVDSSQVERGTVTLHQLTGAAGQAATAARNLGAASVAEAAGQKSATSATMAHTAALQANNAAMRMATIQRTNLLFQLNDIGVSLASGMNPLLVAVQQGSQIAMIYEGGVVPALRATASMAGAAVASFLPLIGIVAALGLGVASLTREIEQAGDKSVNFGDVALAAIQVPAQAIYDYLEPAINGISDWWGKEMDIFADQTGMIVNFLTRNFLVGFETVKSGITTLPDAFIVAGETAANGFIGAIEWMVQRVLEGVNSITGALQGLVNGLGGDFLRDQLGWDIKIPELVDPNEFSLGRANIGGLAAQSRIDAEGAGLEGRTSTIMGTDYAGDAFSAIKDQAGQNATSRIAKENEGAMSKATDAAEKLADAYDNIVQGGKDFIAEKELEIRSIGMTEEAANRLRYEQEMLNQAANDNIVLSGAQRSELGGLAEAMAVAEAAADRAKEAFDFTKGLAKGFITDLRTELEDGASFWEAFGTAGMNVLDKIISKIEDNLVDALLSLGSSGAAGGGIFGWLGSLFANGGVFSAGQQVHAFAQGGVVSKPTLFPMANGAGLMGEAGPEAIMPLRRGPDGRLGVSAANQNQAQSVHVTVGVAADGNGNILPFVQGVAQQTVASAAPTIVGTATQQAGKNAPAAMARYQSQQAGSDYRLG